MIAYEIYKYLRAVISLHFLRWLQIKSVNLLESGSLEVRRILIFIFLSGITFNICVCATQSKFSIIY